MQARGETILVADDEPEVLQTICTLLEKLGYKVISASDGHEAMALYEKMMDSVDALLFDVVMPGCGVRTATQIRNINPDIPLLFCTAYADERRRDAMATLKNFGLIHKPMRLEPLGQMLRCMLD